MSCEASTAERIHIPISWRWQCHIDDSFHPSFALDRNLLGMGAKEWRIIDIQTFCHQNESYGAQTQVENARRLNFHLWIDTESPTKATMVKRLNIKPDDQTVANLHYQKCVLTSYYQEAISRVSTAHSWRKNTRRFVKSNCILLVLWVSNPRTKLKYRPELTSFRTRKHDAHHEKWLEPNQIVYLVYVCGQSGMMTMVLKDTWTLPCRIWSPVLQNFHDDFLVKNCSEGTMHV